MGKLKQCLFPGLILIIGVFLAWKNYSPGTWLIGWDNLHPEFNFSEAFRRVFSGVWRQEQGIGTIAAHSHMADWPRILFLWLSSFVLPLSLLRYFYIFICLILGPLGVYFFIKYTVRGVPALPSGRHSATSEEYFPAFLGALFYLLNLGTLQHFFVPLEMFTTQFAFLPWLFLFALKFLREKGRKNLLVFAILTIISSPQAYAATLFYAYFGALVIFALFYKFKRGLILILLTLFLNFYWILPSIYSVINQSSVVVSAKINQLFSPEAYLRSLSFSDIGNVLIHRSFLFDWRAYDFEKGQFGDLMAVWNTHLLTKYVLSTLYVLVSFSLLGLIFSLFKRDRLGFSLFAVCLYSLFFLTGGDLINSEVLREALRMPFTKFSLIFSFGMSFFFGYFFFRLFRGVYLGTILTLVVGSGLMFSVWPMFQGELISRVVRRNLPVEYFEVFDWFADKSGKIAVLPLNTLWGWEYHNWKYEGSGFLTFGLANPLLVRDFDRWSEHNETFYNQAARALYSGDKEAFERTLGKYQVKYLLLDESIINAGGNPQLLFLPEIKKMVSELGYQEVAKFNFLSIYQTPYGADNFVSAPETYTAIDADLTYSQTDLVYAKYGDYLQPEVGIGYPFVNFDPRGEVEISQIVESSRSWLKFENQKANAKVILPVKEKIAETFGADRGFQEAKNCDLKKTGEVYKVHLVGGISYKAENGGVACDFYNYESLKPDQAYVLRVKGKNKQGRSLKIYLQNWQTNRMDLEELLPQGKFDSYFVIFGGPHTLNLETRSFGRIASENEIERIEFMPFDINFLINLTQNSENTVSQTNNLKILGVKKYGTAIYQVKTQGSGLLELGQGYEDGWLAFRGVTRLEHAKVNSWANGWIIKANSEERIADSNTIYLVFWPQLLEWGGLLILFGSAVILIISGKKRISRFPVDRGKR